VREDGLIEDALGPLLGLLMAGGKFDHTDNQNEIVNPGEKYFQWRGIGLC
jgi:hypothetical protein